MIDGNRAARGASEGCARRLAELQGAQRQWWLHHDPRAGGVAQGFPVSSVRQHVLALMTLAAANGTDHRSGVELSHRWIESIESSCDRLGLGTRTSLSVNYETRPCEWARSLSAGAIASGHASDHHAV